MTKTQSSSQIKANKTITPISPTATTPNAKTPIAVNNSATNTTPSTTPTVTTAANAVVEVVTPVNNVNAPKLATNYVDQVVALYDFQSTTPETIGFQKDSVINIIEKSGDWWLGELNGKIGLLPYNYVQSLTKMSG